MLSKLSNIKGMPAFSIIWFGQLISLMGTGMTKFALLIWAYEQTGKASSIALLGFFSFLPYVLLTPFAGVLIDRFDRKKIMIFSDIGSGVSTIIVFILYLTSGIEMWQLFLLEALLGTFEAFQIPAYSASISLLIPKDHYTRASGMRSFSNHATTILAPILSGAALAFIGLSGVLIVDMVTFVIAVMSLIVIKIPNPEFNKEKQIKVFTEMKIGLKYIFERKGLFYLLLVFVFINLLAAITYFGILPAYILAKSNHDKIILASVQSALGIGGVIGSIIVSVFGKIKRKVLTMSIAGCGSFLLGDIILGLGNSQVIWLIAAFMSSLFLPFLTSAHSALWQEKVDPKIQGRVLSTKGMIQVSVMPIGFLLGGYLADHVFEPMMVSGKVLPFLGSTPGSGMGLMFVINGILGSFICLYMLINKSIRNIELKYKDFN